MGRILVLVTVLTTATALSPSIARGAQLSVVPSGEPGVAVTVRAAGVTQPPCTAVAIRVTACTYD